MTHQKEEALVDMIMSIFTFIMGEWLGLYIILTDSHITKYLGIYVIVVSMLCVPGAFFNYKDYKHGNRKTVG